MMVLLLLVICFVQILVIRSISDVIGKDNLITYDKFLKKSSTEVAEFTLEIINNL